MKNDEPFQLCAGWRGFSHGRRAEQTQRSGAAEVLGMGGACRKVGNWDKWPRSFLRRKDLDLGSPYLIRERGPVKFFLEIEQKTALLFFTSLTIGTEG